MSPPAVGTSTLAAASPISGSLRSSRRPSELTIADRGRSVSPGASAAAGAQAQRELARQVRRLRKEVALLRKGSLADSSPGQAELLTAASARRRSKDLDADAPPTFSRRTFRRTFRSTFHNPFRSPKQQPSPPPPLPSESAAPIMLVPPPTLPLSPPPRPAPPQRGGSAFSLVAASVRDSLAISRFRRCIPSPSSDMELLHRPADQN